MDRSRLLLCIVTPLNTILSQEKQFHASRETKMSSDGQIKSILSHTVRLLWILVQSNKERWVPCRYDDLMPMYNTWTCKQCIYVKMVSLNLISLELPPYHSKPMPAEDDKKYGLVGFYKSENRSAKLNKLSMRCPKTATVPLRYTQKCCWPSWGFHLQSKRRVLCQLPVSVMAAQ